MGDVDSLFDETVMHFVTRLTTRSFMCGAWRSLRFAPPVPTTCQR